MFTAAACGAETAGDDGSTAPTLSSEIEADGVATDAGEEGSADQQDEQPVLSITTDGDDSTDGSNGDPDDGDPEPDTDQGADADDVGERSEDPDGLASPTDGEQLKAALVEAELAIRDRSLAPELTRAWGRRQQSLYRTLSFNPEWAPVLDSIEDPAIREAAALNWSARLSLSSLVATEKTHDDLPTWRVVEPLPPETLIGYYKEAEARTGVPWEYVAGINLVETRMGRIQGISTAGAVGPMQFLPTTWAECCEGDPTNPADAIVGAAKYLTDRGGPENMRKALWGYNNSDYYVDAVTAYADVMAADERAYHGYHGWEIYFLTTEGLIRIPVGYEQTEPILAVDWLAQNPETLFTAETG